MTLTDAERSEITELVRLGGATKEEALQLILMRQATVSDYCLVPIRVRLPEVWIGETQVSSLWDAAT